jgi:hypothetical protein
MMKAICSSETPAAHFHRAESHETKFISNDSHWKLIINYHRIFSRPLSLLPCGQKKSIKISAQTYYCRNYSTVTGVKGVWLADTRRVYRGTAREGSNATWGKLEDGEPVILDCGGTASYGIILKCERRLNFKNKTSIRKLLIVIINFSRE